MMKHHHLQSNISNKRRKFPGVEISNAKQADRQLIENLSTIFLMKKMKTVRIQSQ